MKFENIGVYNMEHALHGMRNPLNSHAKADSYCGKDGCVVIGPNDHELAMRLIRGGEPHRKFLRQIFTSVDIVKAPLFWMLELDTYRIGCTMDSSSTMHRITSRELTSDDFSPPETVEERVILGDVIQSLNFFREKYLELKKTGYDGKAEKYFHAMKRMLPAGYEYERLTWTANYEVLRNIYYWRHAHRLPEWHEFCEEYIKKLPYSEFITEGE